MRPNKNDYLNLAETVVSANEDKVLRRFVAHQLQLLRTQRHWSFRTLHEWVESHTRTEILDFFGEDAYIKFKDTVKRFEVGKFITPKGKTIWGIWDNKTGDWSQYLFHGSFKTKREAEWFLANSYEPTDEDMGMMSI